LFFDGGVAAVAVGDVLHQSGDHPEVAVVAGIEALGD
jgi:hypothetical protein